MTNKLSIPEDICGKSLSRIVCMELKKYKAYKVRIANLQEQQQEGIAENLFSQLLDSDREKILKVSQIERALENSLDSTERQIIEMKYLNTEPQNDLNIYLDLGLQKKAYYEKKKAAISQIAYALGMI